MAEWYADLTRVYESELAYVEENISPTLRRHSLGVGKLSLKLDSWHCISADGLVHWARELPWLNRPK